MTSSRPTILPSSGPHQFAFGCVLMRPRPGLGHWTDRLYGVGVAGSAEGEFDLVPRLQLREINRRNDREFHLHCRPVDGGDRAVIVPVASAVVAFFVLLILESFIPGIFFMSDIPAPWASAPLIGTANVALINAEASTLARRVR